MKILVFALLVLGPSLVTANVSGSWAGQLTYLYTDGTSRLLDCEVVLTQTAATLNVDDKSNCFNITDYLKTLEIRNTNELYYQNQRWGSLADDSFTIYLADDLVSGVPREWRLNLRVNMDQTLTAREIWKADSPPYVYDESLTGDLAATVP